MDFDKFLEYKNSIVIFADQTYHIVETFLPHQQAWDDSIFEEYYCLMIKLLNDAIDGEDWELLKDLVENYDEAHLNEYYNKSMKRKE